ncbi:hypothetical protein D3C80_1150570 [compost metagenome]
MVAGIAAHRQVAAQACRVDRFQCGAAGELHRRSPCADLVQGQQRAGQVALEAVPLDQLQRGQAIGMAVVVGTETLGDHHPEPGQAVSAAWGNAMQQRQLHELGQVQEAKVVLDKER